MSRPAARQRARQLIASATLLGVLVVAWRFADSTRLDRAEFVFANAGEVSSLDPTAVTGIPEGRIAYHLFEGLVSRHPRTLEILPGMADSWEISEDGLAYNFRIRPEARWSDGRPLTAEDFEWSFRRLLSPQTASPNADKLWRVVGAERFSRQAGFGGEPLTPWADVGIRALDQHVLEIRLEHPTPYFLELLSFHALVPLDRRSIERARERWPQSWRSAWLRPENLICNGPYTLRERRVNDRIRLVKNPHYWDAARVAFRTIDALAVAQVGTALNLYLTGEVDWIDRVPQLLVPELLKREDFRPSPHLGVYFYRFNTSRPPFDDVRVREALAALINRREICDKILQAGHQPANRFVPPLPDYKGAGIPAGSARRSQELLAQAGFNPFRGKPFPPFEILYNTSPVHRDIAEVISAGWRDEFRMRVGLRNQEWKVYLDSQRNLDYDVSRSSWFGDYTDPAAFLEIFTSDSPNNRTGWSDPEFDSQIAAASEEPDAARRLQLLQRAELLLMRALPVAPIFFYVTQNMVSPRLGGFFENPHDFHPPKFLYWKDNEELKAGRAAAAPQKLTVPARGPTRGRYPPTGRDTWEELR